MLLNKNAEKLQKHTNIYICCMTKNKKMYYIDKTTKNKKKISKNNGFGVSKNNTLWITKYMYIIKEKNICT